MTFGTCRLDARSLKEAEDRSKGILLGVDGAMSAAALGLLDRGPVGGGGPSGELLEESELRLELSLWPILARENGVRLKNKTIQTDNYQRDLSLIGVIASFILFRQRVTVRAFP